MNDHLREHHQVRLSVSSLHARYRRGMNFFRSRRGALLGAGEARTMPVDSLQQAVRTIPPGQSWMAALPFDTSRAAHVMQAKECVREVFNCSNNDGLPAVQANESACHGVDDVQELPSAARYCRNVETALQSIHAGRFDKVVLARAVQVPGKVEIDALVGQLTRRHPYAYVFAMEQARDVWGRRCLIGASPELLLEKRGNQLISNPLAGSIPRSGDPAEDLRRSQQLLASAKDLYEHALVADSVVAALRPFCSSMMVPAGPSLVATPTMWHLSTEIRGELKDASCTSLDLALALHPTPAVCGFPRQPAHDFIRSHEGFERGLFGGLVGWADASGDGEWAVTIRCADVGADDALVYAGAGVVASSCPDGELAETSAKLGTMLTALGALAAVQ